MEPSQVREKKAGTLLYNNNALAFKKQDGSLARYDQRISSETPLENVTVDFCRHKQLTEACDGACEYCQWSAGRQNRQSGILEPKHRGGWSCLPRKERRNHRTAERFRPEFRFVSQF